MDNCEFIAGDVLKVVDELEDKPDFIVLDPPRDGIHPKAIQKIIDFGVEQMVYISCKPTSLARDLEVFEAAGYKVKRATAVDQFPEYGSYREYGVDTKGQYLKILEFKRFVKHFSFKKISETYSQKELLEEITVVVALDVVERDTRNPSFINESKSSDR